MTTTCALILAGGAGTRLWPLSTDEMPKQFLPLFEGESLLQQTFRRIATFVDTAQIFVSTNARYHDLVVSQLPMLPQENILLEPARRNTAPAIAVCSFEIERRFPGAVVAIFPSDHAVRDEESFALVLRRAIAFAASTDYLVTIGILPTRPDTGFGYLELGEPLDGEVVRLKRFVEKPDHERAEGFLADGNFVWNGGMFVWSVANFREVLGRAAPAIAAGAEAYVAAPEGDRPSLFERMPSISIDYAVMEKAPKVATVRGDFGWSDVGSWAAVAELAAGSGELYAANAENLFLHAPGRKVAVVGFDDVGVIESPRGILVVNLRRSEGLSDLVRKIEEE